MRASRSNACAARWLALSVMLEVLLLHPDPEAWVEQTVGGDGPASAPLVAIVGTRTGCLVAAKMAAMGHLRQD